MKKILILIVLIAILLLLAGDKIYAVLFLISGPAIAYIFIKGVLMDGFSSFVSNLLYGNKQHRAPVEQLSFVRRMISNHQYQESLTELNSIEGDCLEVHKLKMELLYENFKN